MKKNFLSMIAVAFLVLLFGSWSWAQCPEDTIDRGECDTLSLICLDAVQSGSGPYLVRFPLLITHDVPNPAIDSIAGIVIPLTWTHTNPAAYCSVSAFWNTPYLFPGWMDHSIFRDLEISPGDTMFNWMWALAQSAPGAQWANIILNLDGTSRFWLMMAPTAQKLMEPVDHVLITTMTFRIEDTMHVCIDTTFWPPTNRLAFSRSDGRTYIPRHNMPECFYLGPPRLEVTSPNGGESWAVGETHNITWLSENFEGPDVRIQYSTNSGASWQTVVPSTPDIGSYPWLIPDPPSDSCLVRIFDLDGSPIDTSDSVFFIVRPDFAIDATPDTDTVQAGESTDYNVILTSLFGFNSPCTLTVTGLPDYASADFDVNPVIPTDTSIMTVSTADLTPPGTYNIEITATEITKAQIQHITQVVLEVTSPSDFTIEATPDTDTVMAGESTDYSVILTSLFGFSSPCTLTVTGLPDYASVDFDVNPVTPTDTSIMTISTADTTPAAAYEITITATEVTKAQIEHSTQVVLVVTQPDFTIEVEPDTQEVQAGTSFDFDVILTSLYGFASPCTLTVTGLPDYASVDFDVNPVTPTDTSIMTISTADTTPVATYEITITATEVTKAQIEHSTQLVLIVTPPPDFTIEVKPGTLQVSAGDSADCDVILTSLYGYAEQCTLTISGLPSGASARFDPDLVVPTDTSLLTISTSFTTEPNTYTLTVTASDEMGDKIVHTAELTLIVTPGTWFYLEAHPDTQEVVVGDSTTYQVKMISRTSFWQPCTLSVESGLPTGASCSFDPNPISEEDSSSLLTVFTSISTPAGIYELTIRGIINPEQETTTTAVLIVQDFTISVDPDTEYVTAGQEVGYEVSLTSLFGFDDACTLFVSGLPDPPDSGVFDQAILTPTDSTTLNVYTTSETDTIWYTLTITAQRMPGAKPTGLQHSIQVVLKVNESTDAGDWTDNPNTPKSFALFQNQPNPFNPETKISYHLPKACKVKLTIYNVLGQKVKTLFDGHQDAGMQTLFWDGRGDDGVRLSSGIYFYRLQADNFHQTKKMTLMK